MDDGKRGWRALVGGNAWRSMVAALVCVVGLALTFLAPPYLTPILISSFWPPASSLSLKLLSS